MREDHQVTRLRMVRWSLDEILFFPLPEGFAVRWYQPGDEEWWRQIHLRADNLNLITPDLFAEQFGTDPRVLQDRQCYLIAPGNEPIGTATAWFNNYFLGKVFGRVHWVALDPAYQGKGLSRPLLSAVCERLRRLGHARAYLTTSSERLPALRAYRRFGFEPLIETKHDAELWRKIESTLAG